VAQEYATEKKWQWQLAMADKSLQGWWTERRSGDERWWQEMAEMAEIAMMAAEADNNGQWTITARKIRWQTTMGKGYWW
jgi:hypothetical protein